MRLRKEGALPVVSCRCFFPFCYSCYDYEALFADGKLGSIVQPVLTFTEQCGEGGEEII
jgi:hypothetical protein